MPAPREFNRLEHILDSAEYILNKATGRDLSLLTHDIDARSAIFCHFFIIGEAANHLTPELTALHPEVRWLQVVDLGNVMAHEYFGVDYRAAWKVIATDLPQLAETVKRMIADYPHQD